MDYTNNFDLLPDELVLIIIGYVDISNKIRVMKLISYLNGFISLSIRNNNLYYEYIELVNKGIINNFKQTLYENILYNYNYGYGVQYTLISYLNKIDIELKKLGGIVIYCI